MARSAAFVPKTRMLLEHLRGMSYDDLKRLWKCNDAIAGLNIRRLEEMELEKRLAPAILAI